MLPNSISADSYAFPFQQYRVLKNGKIFILKNVTFLCIEFDMRYYLQDTFLQE